jgi:microcystin-dependent protein
MSEPFIGEIRMFGGNFAPKDWAFCNGQVLAISSNTALFSILGTMYGGNGTTTFGLPNLQGAAPLHAGQGPGLTPRAIGEPGGVAQVTLVTPELPSHTHAVMADPAAEAKQASPVAHVAGVAGELRAAAKIYSDITSGLQPMNAQVLAPAGGNQPHNNMPPYLAVSFIISLRGLFPPRG